MVSKSVLYVSGDVPVKAQDIIILENASPNWFGKDFESHIERNEYYTSNPQNLLQIKLGVVFGVKHNIGTVSSGLKNLTALKLTAEANVVF